MEKTALLNMKLHIIWLAAKNYVKQPCDLITLALDMRHPKNTKNTLFEGAMNKSKTQTTSHRQRVYRNIFIYICTYIV